MDGDLADLPDDEDGYPTLITTATGQQRKQYTLDLAHMLYVNSANDAGEPKLTPEAAFTHAEDFVKEALGRGY